MVISNHPYQARRGPRIDTVNNSNDDFDSEVANSIVEFPTYTVHIPPTPDNQPMEISIEASASPRLTNNGKFDRIYLSNSMATGGQNNVTSAHLKEKMIYSETSHLPQKAAGLNGSSCSVPGCDGKVLIDGCGVDSVHCERGCEICSECHRESLVGGGGVCPCCGQPYRKNSAVPELKRSLSSDLLCESKRDYGHENITWMEDGANGNEGIDGDPKILGEKQWRPLTREVKISAAVITLYRLFVLIRLIALGFFLLWRVRNPNEDAMWLWGMSVVCEISFAFSWLLDQLPKLCPINRVTDLNVLKEKFETPSPSNPTGKSDLPGLDIFVSTADPEKEPPLVTANTILSILAADYPVEKLSCYVSDDGGSLLTFEAMAEAATFAKLWVPFCRKHDVEPRNPESYFNLKKDPYKGKIKPDFVRDRRKVKREYEEFKVRVNALSDSIRRRSDAYNSQEEIRAIMRWREVDGDEPIDKSKLPKATWMADATHWPGTWTFPAPEHSRGDHATIIQVMLQPPSEESFKGKESGNSMNLSEVDIRLPMLVYVSREKRPGYDHNKKAGAMNALVRASAVMSNGPFILNLDCDHYIYNSEALREGMCFMMDRDGESICYVQFPQRFEGVDPSDRYANHNTVFFDGNMRALDGIQGPYYVGTGCLFRRIALYGHDPPRCQEENGNRSCCFYRRKKVIVAEGTTIRKRSRRVEDTDEELNAALIPKVFGNSSLFCESIPVAAFQGMPLADHPSVKNGRPSGALIAPRKPLKPAIIAEAVNVISCWFEEKTEWGHNVGWIYGSVTEDVVTGYRMHERGWRSVYCITKLDAFHGSAPINLTDRLHQVLRWATGSVEIFFSRNNALLAGPKLKLLQRIAYLNVGFYPFTSIFLIVYCFIPALALFTDQFSVASLSVNFLTYLLTITLTHSILAMLEIKWSGIALQDWWRNEQFWLIGGTSAHLVAVLQGLLKVIAGIDISFTLTSKSASDDSDNEFADLYIFKYTSLMIPPCTIILVNLIAIVVGVSRAIYSNSLQWSKLLGGVFLSFWVLAHLYPFAKGLMGRRAKTPTVVFVWSGLISICISLLWAAIDLPSGNNQIGRPFQF